MTTVRIAGATVNQTPLDWTGNTQRLRQIIQAARSQGVQLLCLPELSTSGYGCEDAFMSPDLMRCAEQVVVDLLDDCREIVVILGAPHYYHGAMYNCAVVIQNGQVIGLNPKVALAREGVHYEPRWFRPWAPERFEKTHFAGFQVPIGKNTYQFGNFGVAVEICEEAWGAIPSAAFAANSVELVVNPSASHFSLGKYRIREQLVANSSRSMQAYYLYTNLLGLESGRIIYDGGVFIARRGEIIKRGPRFGFTDGVVTYHDIDIDAAKVDKLRNRSFSTDEYQKGASSAIVGQKLIAPPFNPNQLPSVADYHTLSPELEFLFAEMVGLFDYLRKSHSKCYVISLSGGRDSATAAILVAQFITCALAELGAEKFAMRIGRPDLAKLGSDSKLWIEKLLICIYQATSNSSNETLNAAKNLATELGAQFFETNIDAAVNFYSNAAAEFIGRPLSWSSDDISMQNIQARSRAPLAWLLANLNNGILLTTSNRSEAAVGYATMDGDTAGGLAPSQVSTSPSSPVGSAGPKQAANWD